MPRCDDDLDMDESGQLRLPIRIRSRAPNAGCVACEPYGYQRERTLAIFACGAGWTPLRMAWDTNIVIEFMDHGEELLAPVDPSSLLRELHLAKTRRERARLQSPSLALLITQWCFRDIRFYAFESQIRDYLKNADLHDDDLDSREGAIERLRTILHELDARGRTQGPCHRCGRTSLVEQPPPRELTDHEATELDAAFGVPEQASDISLDRERVIEALRHHMDVLLTNDHKLVSRMNGRLSVTVLKPADLIEALADSGEIGDLPWGITEQIAELPAMNPHRLSHLAEAARR